MLALGLGSAGPTPIWSVVEALGLGPPAGLWTQEWPLVHLSARCTQTPELSRVPWGLAQVLRAPSKATAPLDGCALLLPKRNLHIKAPSRIKPTVVRYVVLGPLCPPRPTCS